MTRPRNQLRPLKIQRRFTHTAPGSILFQAGGTTVLCAATVQDQVPPWREGQGKGWITAEYSMLPGSTRPRRNRERSGRIDGRTSEIQRLIGRSLRAVADLRALGERTITVDCDVLDADGGTRTAGVTGGFLALIDALASIPDVPTAAVLRDSVAAVSVGLVGGEARLDLDYEQDAAAEVDMNVVMTGAGRFVEIQGTGEEATFTENQLAALLDLARRGVHQLTEAQRNAMGADWPLGRDASQTAPP